MLNQSVELNPYIVPHRGAIMAVHHEHHVIVGLLSTVLGSQELWSDGAGIIYKELFLHFIHVILLMLRSHGIRQTANLM